MLSAQLGLEPNGVGGQCYLIPYGTNCQFILGYRGMLDLVRRSGEITNISAELVYENDEYDICLGLDKTITHKPNLKSDRGKVIFAYSVATFKDGSKDFIWMTKQDLEKVEKASPSSHKNDSPWKQWKEEMMKKSVIKRHCKTLPISAEIANRINTDETFKQEIKPDMIEEQEGESIKEILVASTATSEDKTAFYEELEEEGVKEFLTTKESTAIRKDITKEGLALIMKDCVSRGESSMEEPDKKKEKETL